MACQISFKASHFPSCWKDDDRMNVLFSIFRSQSVNLVGWHDKMNFWMTLIQDLCQKHQTPVISYTALCSAFERKGRVPQCLDVVLHHMASQGRIMNISDFSKIEQEKGWLGWGFDVLVRKPVTWSFLNVQSMLNWTEKDDRFVVISVVNDLSAKIYQRHGESVNSEVTDNIMFLENLEEQCKDICSGENFRLAMILLQRERKISVFEEDDRQIVKFRKKDEVKVQPLSELDKGILRLRKAQDSVLKEIDRVEEEIKSCHIEAKHMVKTGFKTKAMLALKRKKRLEITLKKKSVELDNVENLLYQLQSSGSEKMVLDAYKAGVQAMKSTVKEDLDLDKIDLTMADVEEMMDNFNEVQETLSKSVVPEDDSLMQYEDELQDLLKAEEKTAEVSIPEEKQNDEDDILKRLENLRSPPQSAPKGLKSATLASRISSVPVVNL